MTQNQHNKTCEPALLKLRQEIDKIDDQILSLLQERMGVVSKVGELKKNAQETFFIRSSREADMIKNLLQKSGNKIPKLTVINIWRKIITAANMHEQSLAIAVVNTTNFTDYEYVLRDYYDNSVPLLNCKNSQEVISNLENNEAKIAAFPVPKKDITEPRKSVVADENCWWIDLANSKSGLKVFAKIPFFKIKNSELKNELFVAAIKDSEKSQNDQTLVYIKVDNQLSKSELSAILLSIEKATEILQMVDNHFLLDINGFYLENSDLVKKIISNKSVMTCKILGHYPTIITI